MNLFNYVMVNDARVNNVLFILSTDLSIIFSLNNPVLHSTDSRITSLSKYTAPGSTINRRLIQLDHVDEM